MNQIRIFANLLQKKMNKRGISGWFILLILAIIGVLIVLGFVPILSDLLGFGEGETASALEKLTSLNKVDLELDASVQQFVDLHGNRQLGELKIISIEIENVGRETAKGVKISYTIAERSNPNERYYIKVAGEEKTLKVDVASKETKPIAFSYEMKYPFERLEFYAEHSEDYSKEDNYETVELEAWCEEDSDCKTAFGAYPGVLCERGVCIVDCEAMGDDLWQEDFKLCKYYPDCEVEEYREHLEDKFRCVFA